MKTRRIVSVEERGTYSIYYNRKGEGSQFALDWAFIPTDGTSENDGKPAEHKWFASVKEGERWWSYTETDKKMREVLLKHFCLSEWKEGYPFEKIKYMSPRDLANERRQKEKEFCLQRNAMKSDTVGFHIDAEEYAD